MLDVWQTGRHVPLQTGMMSEKQSVHKPGYHSLKINILQHLECLKIQTPVFV